LTLVNAAFLLGLLALSIPVIIHLLIRRRFKKMPFSTLRFFLDRDPKLRHRSPSNLLLLLLRLILFGLIVAAFTRPFLPVPGQPQHEEEKPRQIVLILDTTASMTMESRVGSRWHQARALAQNAVKGLSPKDSMALVLPGDPPETKVPMGAPEKVASMLDSLEAGPTTGELSMALDHAVKLLAVGNASAQKEIRIISDLQASTLGEWKSKPVPSDIKIKIMGLSEFSLANASITGIDWSGVRRLNAAVLVKNESENEVLPARKIQLFVDGILRSSQTVDLPAGGSKKAEFNLPELTTGLHGVEVKMESEDGFSLDNIFRQVVSVPSVKKVMVVEPTRSETVWKQKSYFISRALMSSPDGSPEAARFKIDTYPLEGLGIKLRSDNYDLILIPAVEKWSSDSEKELEKHLKKGGAMIVFAGPDMDINQYHSAASWMPVKLRKEEYNQDNPKYLGHYDRDFPAFSLFEKPHSGDLEMAEFTGRYLLEPVEGSRVLASYDDGVPFLVERTLGQGRVYFVNTSADATWSNWPKLKTFLPWLHALADASLGIGGTPSDHIRKPYQVSAYTDIPVPGAIAQVAKITTPGGQEMELKIGNDTRWHGVKLMETGFYPITHGEGQVIDLIAVNIARAESDMKVVNPDVLMADMKRVNEPSVALLSPTAISSEPGRREYWPWILMAALCLVMIEPLIANRT